MNFDLSDDQRTIKSTARELLAARFPLSEVRRLALDDERGWTDAQWTEMVELGWPEIAELAMDVAGPRALVNEGPWPYRFLRSRANSIEGGTTEILKNIVAERVLGLPRMR